MRAFRPFIALLLLLAPPTAHANEPAEVDRLALEGRWAEARDAWHRWRAPMPLGRLDLSGSEVVLWRTAWDIGVGADGLPEPNGGAALREDATWADIRRAGHRLTAGGGDPRAGGARTFPVLEALYAERLIRESRGMGDLPTGSPLASLPDPDGLVARFLAWQAEVYRPTPAEQSTDAAWAAKARSGREHAESLRATSHLWAALSAALLLLGAVIASWLSGRGAPQQPAARPTSAR